ncbi:TPA: DUF551 domain-containing protein [Escherichia coli]|uniref:DUF551 domain-containing protein n=1 Tax=Escherichia marmotae TaxID=1499973 RepID=UPI00249EBB9E|nr:DUF551 domain-containing protein [Escherichia marmotae]MED9548263.1 DUF551 domain-containing protein [Escherichia marmotae]WGY66761.1 DUF551 domain-containing protein [Escherichia marmotae]HBV3781014.1 DUF551 domain-containing protein [Escherichia coli]
MTTITKDRLLTIKQWRETYGPGSNVVLPAEEAEELARIALASLEAEPVAYIFKHPAGKLFWALTDESNKEQPDVIPVYADSPAPVVPDEIDVNDVPRAVTYFKTHRDCYADGWNACRAAMLQSQDSGIKDSWISCSERMPVIGELNWRTGFPLLITCEIGVIPAYYGFVSVNGGKHYGFMESFKYGDDRGGHPQTNEYGLISNVTHWMPLPEPPQESQSE